MASKKFDITGFAFMANKVSVFLNTSMSMVVVMLASVIGMVA